MVSEREDELLAHSTPAELRAMATRALANGDDYSRELLRGQLEAEEHHRAIEILDVEA